MSGGERLGVLIAVAAMFSPACAQPNSPETGGEEIPITRLRAEPYAFAFYSGFDDAERKVIRNVA